MTKQTQLRENILKEISNANLDKTDILHVLDEVEDIVFKKEKEENLAIHINDELRKLQSGESVKIDIILDDNISRNDIDYQLNLLKAATSLREVNTRLDIMENLLNLLK